MIFLVGLRGTGKTTVGRLLAQRLAVPFLDADVILEARAGRSIRDIFAADGETAFRDLEALNLAELIARGPAVIATGGGIVLREANRTRMKAAGKVIWLTADAEALWQRIQGDPTTAERRPNLGAGGLSEIQELMGQREPLYRSVADMIVETAGRSPEEIAADILAVC